VEWSGVEDDVEWRMMWSGVEDVDDVEWRMWMMWMMCLIM